MPGVLAQIGSLLVDVACQQIGNRHARVRRFLFVSHEHDIGRGVGLTQGFRGDDAGRAVAYDDVFHELSLLRVLFEMRGH